MNWTKLSEKTPNKEGDYLIAINVFNDHIMYDVASWSNNLHKTLKWDFPNKSDNHSGFYDSDSEWGFYEVKNIEAWMEIEEYKP